MAGGSITAKPDNGHFCNAYLRFIHYIACGIVYEFATMVPVPPISADEDAHGIVINGDMRLGSGHMI